MGLRACLQILDVAGLLFKMKVGMVGTCLGWLGKSECLDRAVLGPGGPFHPSVSVGNLWKLAPKQSKLIPARSCALKCPTDECEP